MHIQVDKHNKVFHSTHVLIHVNAVVDVCVVVVLIWMFRDWLGLMDIRSREIGYRMLLIIRNIILLIFYLLCCLINLSCSLISFNLQSICHNLSPYWKLGFFLLIFRLWLWSCFWLWVNKHMMILRDINEINNRIHLYIDQLKEIQWKWYHHKLLKLETFYKFMLNKEYLLILWYWVHLNIVDQFL